MKLPLFLLPLFLFSCNSPASTSQGRNSQSEATALPAANPAATVTKSGIEGDVRTALSDKAGNLWFGTEGHGLYRLAPASSGAGTLTHFTERDGLNNVTITVLLEDKAGILWVGTETGLFRYDPSAAAGTKAFTPLLLPVSKAKNVNPFPEKTTDSKQNDIRSLMQDRSGKIWIGTGRDGVYCFDGKLVTHFLHNDGVVNQQNLRLISVNSIVQDESGHIWFATWFEGLCRFDGASITAFKPNNEVWYQSLLVDKAGILWIGRRGKGLVRFNGKEFTNVRQLGTLDSCAVSPEVEDRQGNLWFVSMAADLTRRDKIGGLFRYNPSAARKPGAKPFTNFGPKDGLDSYTILTAVEDRSGTLWVSARNKGLYRYDGKTFTSFSE